MTSILECNGMQGGKRKGDGDREETEGGTREVGTPLNSNTERGEVEVECSGNAERVSRRSKTERGRGKSDAQDGQVR